MANAMLPRCTGICAACAHSSPSPSNTAQEKSRRSLIFGDSAERRSTAPISSHRPARRLANTDNWTGFIPPSPQMRPSLPQGPPGRTASTPASRANAGLACRQRIAPPGHGGYYRPSPAAHIAAFFRFWGRATVFTLLTFTLCKLSNAMSNHYLMPTYNRQPILFTRGEGCWLFDDAGNRYLDGIAGIAVCNLGHCHPAVTRTLSEQAATLVHTSNLYRIGPQEQLAAL